MGKRREMKYLLDTNIIIYYLNGDKRAIDFIDNNLKQCAISDITYKDIKNSISFAKSLREK